MDDIAPRVQNWLSRARERPAIDYALLFCILLIFLIVVVALSNGSADSIAKALASRIAQALR